jgi:hypothetical protein
VVPSWCLLSRPLTWTRPVAGRHARLARELVRVRVVEPGRAISGCGVAWRAVSGAVGGAAVGRKAARHGKRRPPRERPLLSETRGPGEHPRGLRRLWRVTLRPGEPAAAGSWTRCGTRARKRTRLRVTCWRRLRVASWPGPRALAWQRAVAGRGTAGPGEVVRVAPVPFGAIGRVDQASRCEDRGGRQHPVGIVVDLASRPLPRVLRLTAGRPGSAWPLPALSPGKRPATGPLRSRPWHARPGPAGGELRAGPRSRERLTRRELAGRGELARWGELARRELAGRGELARRELARRGELAGRGELASSRRAGVGRARRVVAGRRLAGRHLLAGAIRARLHRAALVRAVG